MGLDCVRVINSPSSGQHKWILTGTNYFTKWAGVVPLRRANGSVVIKFIKRNIFTRFGCPKILLTWKKRQIEMFLY